MVSLVIGFKEVYSKLTEDILHKKLEKERQQNLHKTKFEAIQKAIYEYFYLKDTSLLIDKNESIEDKK